MTEPRLSFPEFLWIWNHVQGRGTPEHHLVMARWLAARWADRERGCLLMAFRGSGKSTVVGLFCAWLLANWPDTRIMVLAAEHGLATRMARNVKRILERHPATPGLKPPRPDQWAADQFTVVRPTESRDPSMVARGVTGNITGTRADVIICDDVEVPNTSDTVVKRAHLRARLSELDYVLTPGGVQVYVGTPHAYQSIYAGTARPEAGETTPFLDGFPRLEIPLLDPAGRSAWPDRFPLATVETIRRRQGPNKFASQMQLRPMNIADSRLDPDRMRVYDDDLAYGEARGRPVLRLGARRLVSASCWWDPALGDPARGGDGSVLAALFTAEDGTYWLHRVAYLTANAGDDAASDLCRQVAAILEALHLPAVTVETNGIGRFLPGLLRKALREAGVAAAVVEHVSTRAKAQRIVDAFDPVLAERALYAHRSVWESPFVAEMREWRPNGGGHDDGLDAVAGCLASEPVRLGRGAAARSAPSDDWRPGAGSIDAAETDWSP
ncbi:phage terminase large subunit [Roseospira navarrensis]|uniref:Phage terminase large subunit n=1 Tax=Roseospira navarrensis TaxID=140058 RepID=A0A7X2D1S3_9PROT|nr:phage terminase large subunit [Roseospira navarrensis]MQX35469.1 phage terminase large subunit [Roseospira navarrensis]